MLTLDRKAGLLSDGSRLFDPPRRSWTIAPAKHPGQTIAPADAVAWLQGESGSPLRMPIGVIGPGDANPEQYRLAEEIGAGLATMKLAIVCGGRRGVMEAVSKGAASNGGLVIGLLPGPDIAEANSYLALAIATGIGEARNALIARASFCLVAIGNNHGTLSEVALGLQFGKPVFGIGGAATLPEVTQFSEVEAILRAVASAVLGIDRP